MNTALVVTTILPPTEPLRRWAAACTERNIRFWVIGDRKTPTDFRLEGAHFIGLPEQQKLDFQLARRLPENHYARKNLGYLTAIREGVQHILETDDDNFPLPAFWRSEALASKARTVSLHATPADGWLNVYQHFSDRPVWPRGFPPTLAHRPLPSTTDLASWQAPIRQGLANHCPDADAIYHLAYPEPLYFREAAPFFVGKGQWCPFNSQATSWERAVFPLLYLPSYAPFRLTDIWRSLIAQRVLWEHESGVLFLPPTVHHERNPHDLLADLEEEHLGYRQHLPMSQALSQLPLRGTMTNQLCQCYEDFVRRGWLPKAELALLEYWLRDIENTGWRSSGC